MKPYNNSNCFAFLTALDINLSVQIDTSQGDTNKEKKYQQTRNFRYKIPSKNKVADQIFYFSKNTDINGFL